MVAKKVKKEETCLVGVERIRRITGYLSTTDRFCDSKLAELKSRTLHTGRVGFNPNLAMK